MISVVAIVLTLFGFAVGIMCGGATSTKSDKLIATFFLSSFVLHACAVALLILVQA